MSAFSNVDLLINDLEIGGTVTFKAVTRWSNGIVTRKVKGFQTDPQGNRTGVYVRYGGWGDFLVRPEEIQE